LCLVLVALALGLQGCGKSSQITTTTSSPTPAGPLFAASPSWSDEFDGCDGGKVDSTKWGYEFGHDVRGTGNEQQNYVNPFENLQNANCTDGKLLISALQDTAGDITSVSLNTWAKKTFGYGRFEMKGRFDTRKGTWPAFWTLGANFNCNQRPGTEPGAACGSVGWPSCGETDIMESNGKEGSIGTNIYYKCLDWTNGGAVTRKVDREQYAKLDHVYTLEWTPTSVEIKVDGESRNCKSLKSKNAKKAYVNNKVMLILNLAVGGNNGGSELSPLPYHYWVDYVRYYPYIGPDSPPSPCSASPTPAPLAPTPPAPPGNWVKVGEGCCHDVTSLPAVDKMYDGPWPAGSCKAKCQSFTNCGYVSEFPGQNWCSVLSRATPCSTLDSKAGDCGSSGVGVQTYRYSVTSASKSTSTIFEDLLTV